MNTATSQMNLVLGQDSSGDADGGDPARGAPMLVLSLDNREWLAFLADDWWPLSGSAGGPRLGVNRPLQVKPTDAPVRVLVEFDLARLPDATIAVFREGAWRTIAAGEIAGDDLEVIWPGPLPIFAVATFVVASAEDRDHLLSMARGFSNIEPPAQPFRVEVWAAREPSPTVPETAPIEAPPLAWNALRGAATMAVWSVPAMEPWLETLCQALSEVPETAPTHREAPWWQTPPWQSAGATTSPHLALWEAMKLVLADIKIREGWIPRDVLTAITEQARRLGGDSVSLQTLEHRTRDILLDRAPIDLRLADENPLGLVLQLLLLRPTAERFVTWRSDLPGMPPAVWWTGATLSGLLTGYRDLEPRYRGSVEARQLLSLLTWKLAKSSRRPFEWSAYLSTPLTWEVADDKFRLLAGKTVWRERRGSSRGRWYRADLADQRVRDAAMRLVRTQYPACLKQCLQLEDTSIPYASTGSVQLESNESKLTITGQASFILDAQARLTETLDESCFRAWLTFGVIAEGLPEPPTAGHMPTGVVRQSRPAWDSKSLAASAPPGLTVVPDYISPLEEKELLAIVDGEPWLSDLRRRVQHYGWKYDYKAREVTRASYLGPLPPWAAMLAERLCRDGLVQELPDQVIVNDYQANQGISKHIDCKACFRGPIITISLHESWGMVFRGPNGQKHEETLLSRSAAILDGPARNVWTHEIPSRKKEKSGPRGRRVSLTFRKVNLPEG